MPLNHIMGEKIEDETGIYSGVLAGPWMVADAQKYRHLPRLKVEVKEWVGKQFKSEVSVQRPVWEVALGYAQIGFHKKMVELNAVGPLTQWDAVVHEYPLTRAIVFIFHAKIRGEDYYVPVPPIILTPQQIAENQQELAAQAFLDPAEPVGS